MKHCIIHQPNLCKESGEPSSSVFPSGVLVLCRRVAFLGRQRRSAPAPYAAAFRLSPLAPSLANPLGFRAEPDEAAANASKQSRVRVHRIGVLGLSQSALWHCLLVGLLRDTSNHRSAL